MADLRSDVPGSLHCGGGKSSGDGGGLFSGGVMYDSGCRKCFAMMFSRLILGMMMMGGFILMLCFVPVRLGPRLLDVGLRWASFGRFHDAVIVGWNASVVDHLIKVGLDDLCL